MVDGLNFKAYRAAIDRAFPRRALSHEMYDAHYRAGRPVQEAIAAIRAAISAARKTRRRPAEWEIEMWSDPLDHDYSMNG